MTTSVNQELNDFFINSFEAFEAQLNGEAQSDFHQVRKAAMAAFKESGLPAPKHEEYKYTAIAKRMQKGLRFDQLNQGSVAAEQVKAQLFSIDHANHLVFVNGEYNTEFSTIVSDEKSLMIKPLREAIKADIGVLEDYKRFDNKEKDAFINLNTAFAHEGLYIKVPKGKVVEAPTFIYHIVSEDAFVLSSNLIVAEENSQAKFVEHFVTLSGTSFINDLSRIVLHKDAIVDHYKIQNDNENSILVAGTQTIHLAQSTFNSTTITLDGGMVRNNLDITQLAEHCESNMYGLYLVGGKTHVDNHTIVDHTAPNSVSNELYKGILEDKATAVFNGKIFVRQAAQKTNAFQSNRNVLLSDDATVNTKPQLEIWADDVKCSHGCTVGQLDEDQLFYLRARGLSKASAKAMLLTAFAEDVLSHIKIEPLHEYLTSIIIDRLVNTAS